MDALINLNRQGIAQISPAAALLTHILTPQSTSAQRINSSGNTNTTLIHRALIAI